MESYPAKVNSKETQLREPILANKSDINDTSGSSEWEALVGGDEAPKLNINYQQWLAADNSNRKNLIFAALKRQNSQNERVNRIETSQKQMTPQEIKIFRNSIQDPDLSNPHDYSKESLQNKMREGILKSSQLKSQKLPQDVSEFLKKHGASGGGIFTS